MAQELGVNLETLRNYEIADGVRLFPVDPNSEDYPGDTDILGDFPLPLSDSISRTVRRVCIYMYITQLIKGERG